MLPHFWKRNGLLSPTFEDFLERFFYGAASSERQGMAAWTPRADISDDKNEVVIDIELPGMKKEDIRVEVRNDVLTISGELKRERPFPTPESSSAERQFGRFERSFPLPDAVNEEGISATYEGGVLTLHLPKEKNAARKQIPVEAAG
ncbi:MAG: Hsp20/alpha crystallin family protein [Candidatus Latescibacterota bacterium]